MEDFAALWCYWCYWDTRGKLAISMQRPLPPLLHTSPGVFCNNNGKYLVIIKSRNTQLPAYRIEKYEVVKKDIKCLAWVAMAVRSARKTNMRTVRTRASVESLMAHFSQLPPSPIVHLRFLLEAANSTRIPVSALEVLNIGGRHNISTFYLFIHFYINRK